MVMKVSPQRPVYLLTESSLLPLMFVTSLLQYLDKQTLNSASIMGIIEDLVSIGTADIKSQS